jgi:hypothetical protein
MPSLREFQEGFARALFEGPRAESCEPGAVGLEVYRNNLREGFRRALALEFPVIERLVGADYFRALALDFQRAHPSRAGDLHPVGAPFPGFLRERFAATEHAYFADVAELEWACAEALVAADAACFDPGLLAAFPEESHAELRWRTAPASRLLASEFPVTRIWRANHSSGVPEWIDLRSGPERVLVTRAPSGVEFHALDAASFAFAAALAEGATLGDAFEAARAQDPDFDPGAALRRLVSVGFLVGAVHPRLEPA